MCAQHVQFWLFLRAAGAHVRVSKKAWLLFNNLFLNGFSGF